MMRYLSTTLLLLAGLSFMIPLLSKPLLAGQHWSERRWSEAHLTHADIDANALPPDVADDSEPCTEIGQ